MARTPARKPPAARRRKAPVTGRRRKPVVIDFHAHLAVPEVLKITYERSMFAKAVAKKTAGGKAAGLARPAMERMTDMALRFREMDAMGIDVQVISPSILHQCTYWAEPEAALKMERISNDRIAETVAAHPDRPERPRAKDRHGGQ